MSTDPETMLWKVEPLSPSGTPPLDIDEEEWFGFDQKPASLEGYGEEPAGLYEEEQLTRAQVASKYLKELEHKNWVKEESFADWFEEKIDIPIFAELPVPEGGQNRAAAIYPSLIKPQQVQLQQQQQQHRQQQALNLQLQQQQQQQQHLHVDETQSLLQEFETVLGDVEACHQITSMVSTLTPPQSPPPNGKQQLTQQLQQQQQQQQHQLQQQQLIVGPNTHLLVSLQPLNHQVSQQAFIYEQQHQQHQQEPESYSVSNLPLVQPIEHWNAENLSLVPLVQGNDEVAHELAKVDEYVRSCAEDIAGPGPSEANFSSSASTASSSPSSAPPSPCTSSNASYISEDSTDDPDWNYEPSVSSSSSSNRRTSQSGRGGRRAANKPYSRPNAEDKRVRKKEQNKNAATRYRQKKKQEIKEILGEEHELADKNEKLQGQLKDLQREIGYLKGLMRDLFKAKGLIK